MAKQLAFWVRLAESDEISMAYGIGADIVEIEIPAGVDRFVKIQCDKRQALNLYYDLALMRQHEMQNKTPANFDQLLSGRVITREDLANIWNTAIANVIDAQQAINDSSVWDRGSEGDGCGEDSPNSAIQIQYRIEAERMRSAEKLKVSLSNQKASQTS